MKLLGQDPCCGLEEQFDDDKAGTRLRDHRRDGPVRSSRLLIEALVGEGVTGATVLDVGAGVGAVHLALLTAGAASAVDVDASHAFLAVAGEEAERLGLADRVTYRYGDLVEIAPELDVADVVTLDRVICCYRDMPALVARSAALCGRSYGLVYPRDAWWTRMGMGLVNTLQSLTRATFRAYVHRDTDVDASLRAAGFAPVSRQLAGVWQVRVFRRLAAGSTAD